MNCIFTKDLENYYKVKLNQHFLSLSFLFTHQDIYGAV